MQRQSLGGQPQDLSTLEAKGSKLFNNTWIKEMLTINSNNTNDFYHNKTLTTCYKITISEL